MRAESVAIGIIGMQRRIFMIGLFAFVHASLQGGLHTRLQKC